MRAPTPLAAYETLNTLARLLTTQYGQGDEQITELCDLIRL